LPRATVVGIVKFSGGVGSVLEGTTRTIVRFGDTLTITA
jgi:hypothetical protein